MMFYFEKHRSFAENPLLLSMMFLTFMQNNSIPNHLVEFYEKAFQALYNHHDSRDKGIYKREFSCNELDETGFKRIFSRFCFQSYFKETYEFTEKELTNYLEDSIKKLGYTVDAVNYLKDLHDVVCLIIREGNSYRFAHRSFQTYFAAHYTSNSLTDEQQEKVFDRVLDSRHVSSFYISPYLYPVYSVYFDMLFQIEPQRFLVNAFEKRLRRLIEDVDKNPVPEVSFLKLSASFFIDFINSDEPFYWFKSADWLTLFFKYVNPTKKRFEPKPGLYKYTINHLGKVRKYAARGILEFEDIDTSDALSDDERSKFYSALVEFYDVKERLETIRNWLAALDEKRRMLAFPNFIDEL